MGSHLKNQSSTFDALKILKNRMGMSLVEVLVALAMVGILASVMASVMDQMQKAQNQVNIVNTIESMRLNIQKLAADGTAWRATVLLPANSGPGQPLNCVQTNNFCPDSGASGIPSNETVGNAILDNAPFLNLGHLEQAAGGSYIDSQTSATSGYTDKGTPCNTWSAAGNDACPIRWKIKIAFECQIAAVNPCLNPTIRVVGILYYRRTGLNGRTVINENKYRVDLRRGAQGDTRSERFLAEFTGAPGANGGSCVPSAVVPYDVPPAMNENGNVIPAAGGNLTFQAGTYTCTAMATCFACGKVRLELRQAGTATHKSLTLLSKRWDQTQVSISNATFTISANTLIQIVEVCETDPGGDASLSSMNMGMALPNYTQPTKFAEIQCTRIF